MHKFVLGIIFNRSTGIFPPHLTQNPRLLGASFPRRLRLHGLGFLTGLLVMFFLSLSKLLPKMLIQFNLSKKLIYK